MKDDVVPFPGFGLAIEAAHETKVAGSPEAQACSDLDKAREVFAKAIKHRPRINLTIRQRTRVLERWPAR